MVPSAFVALDAFPLSTTGKIDRRALPAPDTRSVAESGYVPPATEAGGCCARSSPRCWTSTRSAPTTTFFALGGHSLLATRAIARIRARFRTRRPLQAVFERRSPRRLAETLGAPGTVTDVIPARPPHRPAAAVVLPAPPVVPGPAHPGQRLLERRDGRPRPRPARRRRPRPRPVPGGLPARGAAHGLRGRRRRPGGRRPPRDPAPPGRHGRSPTRPRRAPWPRRTPHAPSTWPAAPAARPRAAARPRGPRRPDHRAPRGHRRLVARRLLGRAGRGLPRRTRRTGRRPARPARPVRRLRCLAARGRLTGAERERHLAYWRTRLAGLRPLELPLDRPRPAVAGSAGASQPWELPEDLVRAARAFGDTEGATLYMTLLTAFTVVLARFAGTEDVAVGTPVAGRTRPGGGAADRLLRPTCWCCAPTPPATPPSVTCWAGSGKTVVGAMDPPGPALRAPGGGPGTRAGPVPQPAGAGRLPAHAGHPATRATGSAPPGWNRCSRSTPSPASTWRCTSPRTATGCAAPCCTPPRCSRPGRSRRILHHLTVLLRGPRRPRRPACPRSPSSTTPTATGCWRSGTTPPCRTATPRSPTSSPSRSPAPRRPRGRVRGRHAHLRRTGPGGRTDRGRTPGPRGYGRTTSSACAWTAARCRWPA
ncbi:condensation domain-containing protein [Streptomyces tricolor]|nr:condensation domain-containing protein [Streptomyces tricolor]